MYFFYFFIFIFFALGSQLLGKTLLLTTDFDPSRATTGILAWVFDLLLVLEPCKRLPMLRGARQQ